MKPVCIPCKKEMKVMKNDEVIRYESGGRYHHTAHADRWKCRSCEQEIWAGFGTPYYDADAGYDYTLNI